MITNMIIIMMKNVVAHDDEHNHHHDEECKCHDQNIITTIMSIMNVIAMIMNITIMRIMNAHQDHEHHHADEVFTSWGVETPKKYSKAEINDILKTLAESSEYGVILRAKGIVPCTRRWMD